MITQSKDFLNNIHYEFQDFLTTSQGSKDDLPDIWYAIDYEDVDNTLTNIEKENLENRPIIHGMESDLMFNEEYQSSSNG